MEPFASWIARLPQRVRRAVRLVEQVKSSNASVLARLPSKTIMLGVLDLSTPEVGRPRSRPSPRASAALPYVATERIVAAPDCGLKYLPRGSAFGKMRAMAEGAAIVQRELS